MSLIKDCMILKK